MGSHIVNGKVSGNMSRELYTCKKPEFVDKSYLSIILGDLIRGKPLRGMQKAGVKFFYENSTLLRHVIENPGGEKALHDIYTYPSGDGSYTRLDRILLSLRACRGTRRRKEEYRSTLMKTIEELYGMNNTGLNIIDLGSGRGSIPIESVHNFIRNNGNGRDNLRLVLVDRDREALEMAKRIAEARELSDKTEFKGYNVRRVSLREPHGRYHIVGTHGLLDYFPDEEAIKFFHDMGDILVPGGILITTNMIPHNDWVARKIMEVFGSWILTYRTPREFQSLVEKSGRYEIIGTVVVGETETHTLDHSPTNSNIKGFHTIITARKKE